MRSGAPVRNAPSSSRSDTAWARRPMPVAALVLVCALTRLADVGVRAQQSPYPVFSADTFAATMKSVGQNFAGTTQAISNGDYESAKARAIRAREQLATTVTFWRKNGREDAVAMLRAVTLRFDELDTILSRAPVDTSAAGEAARQIGTSCQACHSVYREQDPATKAFKLKL